jgi:nitroreductase
MVRTYQADRPVPPALLRRALEHALRAPSAGFTQGWDLLTLVTAEDRERFWQVTTGAAPAVLDAADGPPAPGDRWLTGMRTAPVLVLCLSDPHRYLDRYAEPDKGWSDRDPARWPIPYWDVDTGMAALLVLLTAVDDGLGGCFFGVPADRHPAVRQSFGVPDSRRVVGVVSLGYPAPDRRSPSLRRGRRPAAEVLHLGRFGTPLPEP